MPISLLDAVTIGQIAAGEVIERPVSVVKECVENALDAGATRISVYVKNGGLDEIEIVDNGEGIAGFELPLALTRHATSKLQYAPGLTALATLGFRGEGLASIAAVARVRLRSRQLGAECASEVTGFEELVSAPQPAAGPVGTAVQARDLFANVPVRREYLRSPQAETTRIMNFLTTLALGYPHVAFILQSDGREVLNLPPAVAALDRVAHVFGRDSYEKMLPITAVQTGMHGTIGGFISRPGVERSDRRQQILFVNGRLLRSSQLAGAWAAGYIGYTQTGRHPFGVLLIELPADHLDPNVHPTKNDVRFRYPAQVVDAVKRVLATTLHRNARERLGDAVSLSPSQLNEPIFGYEAPSTEHVVSHETLSPSPSWQNTRRISQAAPDRDAAELLSIPSERYRVLAQLDRAFILATDGRGIIVVDQHAAHERIAYEAIVAGAADPLKPLPQQPLLVPEIIEVTLADAQALEASLDALRAAGVELEAFGERVYRLTAMPLELSTRHFNIRGYLEDLDDETPALDARERVWATMACHSVVRAGETMQIAEMQTVVDRLARCANPMHCPHGRPTIVRFDAPAIARFFRRG